MIKKTLAALSIAFAVFVWYMAAHAGARENQDWAPIGAVFYGLIGGTILMVIAIGSTLHFLKKRNAARPTDDNPPTSPAPMLIFLNAGWILTVLAALKVLILN